MNHRHLRVKYININQSSSTYKENKRLGLQNLLNIYILMFNFERNIIPETKQDPTVAPVLYIIRFTNVLRQSLNSPQMRKAHPSFFCMPTFHKLCAKT